MTSNKKGNTAPPDLPSNPQPLRFKLSPSRDSAGGISLTTMVCNIALWLRQSLLPSKSLKIG
jgi:hypothetical protein